MGIAGRIRQVAQPGGLTLGFALHLVPLHELSWYSVVDHTSHMPKLSQSSFSGMSSSFRRPFDTTDD